MASSTNLGYFALILFYLLFVSTYFAIIINDKEGTSNNIGISLPYTYETSSYQDYTSNNSYFNENLIAYGFSDTAYWEKTDLGFKLIQDTFSKSVLLLKNIVPDDGIYDVTYFINNTPLEPFSIYPQHSNDNKRIEIYIDSSGYHILDYLTLFNVYFIPTGDLYFYEDSSLMTTELIQLRTLFDTKTGTLSLYKGDEGILVFSQSEFEFSNDVNTYYAGISSQSEGIKLEKVYGKMQSYNPDSDRGITYALNYVFSMLQILFWVVDEMYLPLVINVLVVKFPLVMAIIFFIMIIRGV